MKNFFSMNIKLTLLISWIQLIACSQVEEGRVSIDTVAEDPVSRPISGLSISSPTLSAIVNATDRSIPISWDKIDGFDGYEVKIERDSGSIIESVFREISILGMDCRENTCVTNLISPTENFFIASESYSYRAQIRGFDRSAPNARYSAWSAVQEFSISASEYVTSLTIPQILTPNHNTTQNNKTVRISWQGSNGATFYRVWINRHDGENGNSNYLNQWVNINENNICLDNLTCSLDRVLPNGSYSLWIQSWAPSEDDTNGLFSEWTTNTDFVVSDSSQTSGAAVEALSVAQANTNKPQFIWNDVNSADGYEVYLCHKNVDTCNTSYVFRKEFLKAEICENDSSCTLSYEKMKETDTGWHNLFTSDNTRQNPWFGTEEGLVGSSDPHLNKYDFWVKPYQGGAEPTQYDWRKISFSVGNRNAVAVIADLNVEQNDNDTVFSWHHIEGTTQYRLYVGMVGDGGFEQVNRTNAVNDRFEVDNSVLVIENGKASLSYEAMKSLWQDEYRESLPVGDYVVWVRASVATSLIDEPWSHRVVYTVSND